MSTGPALSAWSIASVAPARCDRPWLPGWPGPPESLSRLKRPSRLIHPRAGRASPRSFPASREPCRPGGRRPCLQCPAPLLSLAASSDVPLARGERSRRLNRRRHRLLWHSPLRPRPRPRLLPCLRPRPRPRLLPCLRPRPRPRLLPCLR
ncbi:hypothetical protein DYH09_15665, partial [bacterium CPR1]|nr:hypothetical protein [bacterium CPR1]